MAVAARVSIVRQRAPRSGDRWLLRDCCRSEWVLLLDADTEVRRSFGAALAGIDVGDAVFVGQIHPQMPHLYAYLAHLLVHRARYRELPRVSPSRRARRRLLPRRRARAAIRSCAFAGATTCTTSVRGRCGGSSNAEIADNEFYDFAVRSRRASLRPQPALPGGRIERVFQDSLGEATHRRALPRPARAPSVTCRSVADRSGRWQTAAEPGASVAVWRDAIRCLSPRRARALRSARRMGMTQMPSEASDLLRIVERLRPRRVIEIGTTHGGSLLLWARAAAADATLVSIDLPPWEIDDPGESDKRRAIERVGSQQQSVYALRGDSHDPAVQARAHACLGGRAVDFLFLDADHSYEGVRATSTSTRASVGRVASWPSTTSTPIRAAGAARCRASGAKSASAIDTSSSSRIAARTATASA